MVTPSPGQPRLALEPSAPPLHLDDQSAMASSPPAEALALPPPMQPTPPTPIWQHLLQSLCELQQQPCNVLVQRWLQSQVSRDPESAVNLSYPELCTALGIKTAGVSMTVTLRDLILLHASISFHPLILLFSFPSYLSLTSLLSFSLISPVSWCSSFITYIIIDVYSTLHGSVFLFTSYIFLPYLTVYSPICHSFTASCSSVYNCFSRYFVYLLLPLSYINYIYSLAIICSTYTVSTYLFQVIQRLFCTFVHFVSQMHVGLFWKHSYYMCCFIILYKWLLISGFRYLLFCLHGLLFWLLKGKF